VTNRSAICHFLLVPHCNQTSISNRFEILGPQIPCAHTHAASDFIFRRHLAHAMFFGRQQRLSEITTDPINSISSKTTVSKCPYLRNQSSDPLHVLFYGGVFGDGGSNGAISSSNKSKMAAAAILKNFKWPYLCNRSTSRLVIGWGFRGRRI